MTIRVGVLSLDSEFIAGTAMYFEPLGPSAIFGVPTDTDSMADGVGEFQLNVSAYICATIQATNGDVLRTGIQSASVVGEMDGNVLELPYVIYPVTEVLSFSDLASEIPPISEGGLTATNIGVTRRGDNLLASGDVSVAGINGTFTYEFRLVAITSAMSASILQVETVEIDLNLSGVLGWLVNGYIDVLLSIMEDPISVVLEAQVQTQIDQSVAERLADEGPIPDGVQTTVQSVVLSASDVTVNALVAVPARAIDCPFTVADGSVKIRRGEQLRKLRRMRRKVLMGNPRGDIYIALDETPWSRACGDSSQRS